MSTDSNSKANVPTLYLGCPVWACSAWVGNFFTDSAKSRDYLPQYSTVFNTVEGNSTFYALPSHDTAKRWASETKAGFRFSLKFPRIISHDRELIAAERETATFLELLAILFEADRLGPTFLQLGPNFDRRQFPALEKFLEALPREFPFAVEVRHRDYFDEGSTERAFDELLQQLKMDRVIFDSRALYSAAPSTEAEVESQRRKPRSPIRHTVTGSFPMLRFIGRDDVSLLEPWINEWAPIVAGWLRAGLSPFVFTHTPNDYFAPEFARRFHCRLSQLFAELPPLSKSPHELQLANKPKQRQLF